MSADPTTIAAAVLDRLERAWNAADGAAFGAAFADDTDFVDIRGEHHHGDGTLIGLGHTAIFDTIYAGSTVRYRLDRARSLAPGYILALATSTLDAPTGPLQGVHNSRFTTVLREQDGEWAVIAFHNTLVSEATADARN